MGFTYEDYPSLFRITDKYSTQGQRAYLRWIRLELIVLTVIAIISIIPISSDHKIYGQILAILSALGLSTGIVITLYIKNSKFENDWYIGRALAESIKSLTWKYITRGEPFNADLSIESADGKFITVLKNILEENRSFLKISYQEDDGVNITDRMREIREESFQQRKDIYIQERVRNQQNWYKSKARLNKNKTRKLFLYIVIFQAAALIYSLYLITDPYVFNIVPLVTTMAAALLSWLQVKQHQELSQSYAVAANEINLILSQEPYINTEEKLKNFIADSENAFSREHTLWTARRDVLSYKN